MQQELKKAVIIGTGSVAFHLSLALSEAGVDIVQVYGRNPENAKQILNNINAAYTSDVKEIIHDADLYILALSENAIKEFVSKMPRNNKLLVHTSGSVDIKILEGHSDNFGVFYPLQTFSKNDIISFNDIPFCIEANTPENLEKLKQLAKAVSRDVRIVSSEQRRIIHLTAVLVCNFPNFLYSIAENILRDQNIGFDILLPLINRTTAKIGKENPSEVQTGPANRGDMHTLQKHMELLENEPEFKEIYKLLSEAIIKQNLRHKT